MMSEEAKLDLGFSDRISEGMVYFISDLHLGATYLPDAHDYERRVVDWLYSIRHDATELHICLVIYLTTGMNTAR